MAAPTSQSPLQTVIQSSRFPQTGSWSMVDIAKLSITLPIGMLQRYAASRVQPMTILVAEAMGMTFRSSSKGRLSVEEALAKLPTQRLNASLEIGFGVQDITRMLARSEAGTNILALCAGLKDCYPEDHAVDVLLEYARATKADPSSMPSNSEWRALLDVCAGSLSNSTFALRAETLMQICEQGCETLELPRYSRPYSESKSMAMALSHLADLTCGKSESVTLCGGPDIGWVATVAEWLLDLRIAIYAEDSDVLFYRNFGESETCQVRFLCRKMSDQSLADNTKASSMSMQKLDSTRLLSLVEANAAIFDLAYPTSVVAGRLQWETALRSTFLSEFELLMSIPDSFGTIIGCAARIASATIDNDEDLVKLYGKMNRIDYCDASHGAGLVDSLMKRFAELSPLHGSMVNALTLSVWEALIQLEHHQSIVYSRCSCLRCQAVSGRAENGAPTRFCSLIVVHTIVYICRLLSNVRLMDESLTPSRRGFEMVHKYIKKVRGMRSDGGVWISLITGTENNGVGSGRLSDILQLFTGREAGIDSDKVSAIHVNGLTAFVASLTSDQYCNREDAMGINVISGRIFYETKSYTRIEDWQGRSAPTTNDQMLDIIDAGDVFFTQGLLVQEGPKALRCTSSIATNSPSATQLSIKSVGPAEMAWFLGERRGLVKCDHKRKPLDRSDDSCEDWIQEQLKERWVRYSLDDRHVQFWYPFSGSHFVALTSVMLDYPPASYVLEDECRSCCLRAAQKAFDDDVTPLIVNTLQFIYAPPG